MRKVEPIKIPAEIQKRYEDFIKTDKGIEWKQSCGGDLGDFIYDFYPEMLL